MTQSQYPPEDGNSRAAVYLARALAELQHDADGVAARELAASRSALEALAQQIQLQLADEREQRIVLASQLTSLAGSLERLVGHLQGMSELMTGLLERATTPAAAPIPPPPAVEEPAFQPGGEGVSFILAGVPGFQALMDIQKALLTVDAVAGVSVERFQEGDSRVLVHLQAPQTGSELATALRNSSGLAFTVEESRPELQRLRLKYVPSPR